MSALYAVLLVPDFPAATLLAGKAAAGATAVVSGEPPNQFVCSVNERARKRGVRDGMPLAEARARYGFSGAADPLDVLERKPEREERLQRRLIEAAESTSPRYEDSGPGVLTIDFRGLREPHESARRLAQRAADLGLSNARVGVSRNRFAALCAARLKEGVTHVYPGEEAGFLSVQPVDALPLEESERATLARWGVGTLGELARLPANDLAERFGERGARLLRMARGEQETLLKAYEAPPHLEEKEDLDWEVVELEPLAFVLSGMLERLCLKLQGHNLAAESLKTSLKLVRGGLFERRIDLPSPLADPRTLLSLVRIDLDAHPPGDAIEGVRVLAQPTERRRLQFALFAPDRPNPEKLATTLARLTALAGADRVGAPALADTHRPGAAAVVRFQERAGKGRMNVSPRSAPLRERLCFRCYRPPKAAQTVLREERPVYVDSDAASGPVTRRSGPWRVSGEWWTNDGWQFEEWDVEVEGRLYRACLDREAGRWFLTGEYD